MQRPELQDDGSYACPKGFKACNEGFFEKPSGQDYVICYPNNEERDENCPITDLLFIDPAGQGLDGATYERVASVNGDHEIFISRDKFSHGIETVSVSVDEPCLDTRAVTLGSNQPVFFAELN